MLTEKMKALFEGVRASSKLKSDTAQFLQSEIERRKKARKRLPVKGYAAALMCAAIILMSGLFTHSLYFTAYAYVDLDVNPSVELELNRFDRVIGVHAYNDRGEEMISGLSLAHKSCADALGVLMQAAAEQMYLQQGELVSITVQTDDTGKEAALLEGIQVCVEGHLAQHRNAAQADVFAVSRDIRSCSHELGVSPAKYLAILELIEADPSATAESCRSHSISELREMTREHGMHNGENGGHGHRGKRH